MYVSALLFKLKRAFTPILEIVEPTLRIDPRNMNNDLII